MVKSNHQGTATERDYRALIDRIADDEPNSGWHLDVDLQKGSSPLTDDELAVVCSMHAQAVTDELSMDPTLIARFLRREIDANALLAHLRTVAEVAVWQAVREDVLEECNRRNEMRAEAQYERFHGGDSPFNERERLEVQFGMGRTFR